MAHTAWMECGSSATPPSPCPNTGATVSCPLSLASQLPYYGAFCSPASPSATSGPWFPASRAAWSSRNASAAFTHSAFRPFVIPSLKLWARFSAACAWHYAKKSNNSHCSLKFDRRKCCIFLYSKKIIHPWHSALQPTHLRLTVTCSTDLQPDIPCVHLATRSALTAAAGSMVFWQLWRF